MAAMASKYVYSTDDRVELLKRLVEINSGTSNIAGVNEIQRVIRPELEKLGFQTRLIPNPDGSNLSAELLVGTIIGKYQKFVTLVCHADTVFEPKSAFQNFTLSHDGATAVGPGVIDDKGGIIVAIKGVQNFLAKESPNFSIRLVCAPSEETGSHGYWSGFSQYGKDSAIVLGFEPALDNGSIIHSRRGNRWYHIEVEGKAAHAGRAHHKGINAGHELAIKLDKLQRLTDYKKEVTVSIASLSGGSDKYNVVCANACAKIDARFTDRKSADALHKKVVAILKKVNVKSYEGKRPSKTRFRIDNDCPAFTRQPSAVPFLKAYLDTLKELEGKTFQSERSGGAADSNGMSREGLIIIDGLGPVGGGMHTVNEFVKISSLYTRAEALTRFLNHVNKTLKLR